ncbi:MAG: DNA adenine methylase [Bacteroidota bacterium]
MPTIKSPLRYPGGKSRAVKFLAQQLPVFQEYREPFVGGGSLFVHCQQNFPECTFWINDLYTELYRLWHGMQVAPTEVLEQIWIWRRQYAHNGRALYQFLTKGLSDFSPMETASAFFILNRITFSGTSESGGYSKQAFERRFTTSSITRLEQIIPLLKSVHITNLDYSEVVLAAGERVFIFLDPPYYSATKSALYGKKGNFHKGFDHERFAATMRQCPHRWMITYDDSTYIRSLFDFANIKEWQLTYGMRNVNKDGQQRQGELLITNFWK